MKPGTKIPPSAFIRPAFLLLTALIISIFSFFPLYVERWYSGGVYPGISVTLRLITRWVPFSIGDILYVFVCIWFIIKLIRFIRSIVRQPFTWQFLSFSGLRILSGVLWLYIIFKLLWGLNYDRLGIAYQLNLSQSTIYTKEEVTALTDSLIVKVNESRRRLPDSILPSRALADVYRGAYRCYQEVSIAYPFLNYQDRSVKATLFAPLADYIGFTGYYNPFTGEAQLRTDVPHILIPYVVCHEMAHQLGYASESEANFVGYLAAATSSDPYFRYSVYLDLFSYAQSEEVALYARGKDFKAFENVISGNRAKLDTLVKKDRRMIRDFFNKRRNRIAPAMSGLYDQYLKMNRQTAGVKSYDQVIGWLIAYSKKTGRL